MLNRVSERLGRFFAAKAQSGEAVSQDESAWIQGMLAETAEAADEVMEESLSVIGHGETISPFDAHHYALEPAYDPTEVLKKYQKCYQASSTQPRRPVVHQTHARPSVPHIHHIFSPVLEMLQPKPALPAAPPALPDKPAGSSDVVLVTKTASSIMASLGEPIFQEPTPSPEIPPPVVHRTADLAAKSPGKATAVHRGGAQAGPVPPSGGQPAEPAPVLPVFHFAPPGDRARESALMLQARQLEAEALPSFSF